MTPLPQLTSSGASSCGASASSCDAAAPSSSCDGASSSSDHASSGQRWRRSPTLPRSTGPGRSTSLPASSTCFSLEAHSAPGRLRARGLKGSECSGRMLTDWEHRCCQRIRLRHPGRDLCPDPHRGGPVPQRGPVGERPRSDPGSSLCGAEGTAPSKALGTHGPHFRSSLARGVHAKGISLPFTSRDAPGAGVTGCGPMIGAINRRVAERRRALATSTALVAVCLLAANMTQVRA